MSILQSIVLGLIQGLTEFIPVSSSGHLVLVRVLFGWEDPGVAYDTILHLGTLLAVVIYFWKTWQAVIWSLLLAVGGVFSRSLWRRLDHDDARLLGFLILGTIPAVAAGYFLRDFIDEIFRNIVWVTAFLMATGILYVAVERARRFFKRQRELNGQPEFGSTKFTELTWRRALFIGMMQAIAILPGVSRSGLTIAGGVFSGLTREAAARFAFLLAGPVILAAGILGIFDLAANGTAGIGLTAIIVGFAVSLVAGYWAVQAMIKFLQAQKLYLFSIYLVVLGIVIFLLSNL